MVTGPTQKEKKQRLLLPTARLETSGGRQLPLAMLVEHRLEKLIASCHHLIEDLLIALLPNRLGDENDTRINLLSTNLYDRIPSAQPMAL